jgi:hypothetical protein
MFLELFVHVAHLSELQTGKAVNCKYNYASQYDMRILIDPRKYIFYQNSTNQNMVTIKRKSILDYLKIKKKSNK